MNLEAMAPLRAHPLRRVDYHRLAAGHAFDGQRVQLVEGTVVAMGPMGANHAWVMGTLTMLLTEAVKGELVVRVQLPLAAADDSEPEPDFALVPSDSIPRGRGDHPSSALLAIEVADSSRALDLGAKATLYARCGVGEYWVVDLNSRRLVVHREPVSGKWKSVKRFARGKTVRSEAVPSIEISVSDVLP